VKVELMGVDWSEVTESLASFPLLELAGLLELVVPVPSLPASAVLALLAPRVSSPLFWVVQVSTRTCPRQNGA
jgi:hypothetical protein